MAHLTQRYCPKCGKSIGLSVVAYEHPECADRWCIDCGKKRPQVGDRCIDCYAKWKHKSIEEAYKKAGQSRLGPFGLIR